jgi:hypothetical protein
MLRFVLDWQRRGRSSYNHFDIETPRSFRFLSDEQLLSQCRVDHYRGSGPGGQKRNKTSNGVRFAHLPTGILATATESRSLKENHLYCLRRLRVKLAAEVREGVDPIGFEVPDWFLSIRHERKIDVSHRHEFYAATAGLILDLLSINGNPAAVAADLGVTTTAVVKILEAETAWWAAANEIRAKLGMAAMQSRGHRNRVHVPLMVMNSSGKPTALRWEPTAAPWAFLTPPPIT